MKKLCASIIVLSMIGASFLYGDELSEKKQKLEKQIAELEAQQNKQKEVEELERKLQQLQSKTDEKKSSSYQSPSKTTQETTQALNQDTTQEMRDDEESKLWFAKNRNGVLIGAGLGLQATDYSAKPDTHNNALYDEWLFALALKVGYQSFPGNKIFGWRAYLDYFYSGNIGDGQVVAKVSQQLVALNFDLLADFNVGGDYYLGFFVGAGYGKTFFEYEYTPISYFGSSTSEKAKLEQPSAFINVGAAITIESILRIELYAKFPTPNNYDEKFYWKTSPIIGTMAQFTF